MKTKEFFSGSFIGWMVLLLATPLLLTAQAPQSFSYQAIVRGNDGNPLMDQLVSVQVKIHQGADTGPVVYCETHATTTNPFGLVNLEIGLGTVVSGSFPDINWETGLYFLELELDPEGGTTFVPMGTTQLVSVPYALFSENTGQMYSAGTGIDISSYTISNTSPDQVVSLTAGSGISTGGTYPNFTVTNASPDQVISLIPGSGVSIGGIYPNFTVSNTAPNAVHTGDATGGGALTVVQIQGRPVSAAAPAVDQVLQWSGSQWNPATLPAITPAWSLNGNNGTNPTYNFLGTTDYKSLKFRVANEPAGEINPINFNVFLGYEAGANSTGNSNVAFGWFALNHNQANSGSTAIGSYAMYLADDRSEDPVNTENTAVGYKALQGGSWTYSENYGVKNTALGSCTLYQNTSGSCNTGAGAAALASNTTGNENTAQGYMALFHNTTGNFNTALGQGALLNNKTRHRSTAVGYHAMYHACDEIATGSYSFNTAVGCEALRGSLTNANNTGKYNTAVGDQALFNNTSGSDNAAMGFKAIHSNSTGSFNTATGFEALYSNESGNSNVGTGPQALYSNTSGNDNTAIGYRALYYNTTGSSNVAFGPYALFSNKANDHSTAIGYGAMYYADNRTVGQYTYNTAVGYEALKGSTTAANNTGKENTAIGEQSLYSNTSGSWNVASGYLALYSNTTGICNTANGHRALFSCNEGNYNTAVGMQTLLYNAEGDYNAAIGFQALFNNTTGSNNVAIGYASLHQNKASGRSTAIGVKAMYNAYNGTQVSSSYNTAVGYEALYGSNDPSNNNGSDNTAVGDQSMYKNTSGCNNATLGSLSLFSNTSGSDNTAVGHSALYEIIDDNYNTALGYQAGRYNEFSYSTFLGANAYPNADGLSNCMALGYNAKVNASNKVVIGNTSVTSIGGYEPWTDFSDGRFKKNVSENVPGLEFITQLRPVTYTLDVTSLNADLNKNRPATLREGEQPRVESADDRAGIAAKERIVYTGFIAQEVEEAAQSIGYDFRGVDAPQNQDGHYGLRYAEFVAPLVRAIQEQQAIIEALQEEVRLLKENQAVK